MTKRAAFSQADLERAARALKAVGEKIGGVEIRPDGSFRVLTGAEVPVEPASELSRWRQARGGRAA